MGVIILSEREMSVEMDGVKMKDDVVVDESPGDNSNAGKESDTGGDISETDEDVAGDSSVEDDKQTKAKPRTRKGRTNTKKTKL